MGSGFDDSFRNAISVDAGATSVLTKLADILFSALASGGQLVSCFVEMQDNPASTRKREEESLLGDIFWPLHTKIFYIH